MFVIIIHYSTYHIQRMHDSEIKLAIYEQTNWILGAMEQKLNKLRDQG